MGRVARWVAALAVVGAVGLAACGGSATSRSDLVSSFRRKDATGRQFSQAQAECAADATLRTLSQAEVKIVVADGVDGLPKAAQDRWGDAVKRCLTS